MADTTTTWRRALGGCLAAIVLLTVIVGNARPAHADRCEPDELAIRLVWADYESPSNENTPHCVVTIFFVYPLLACDSTTLMTCLATVNTDPRAPRPITLPERDDITPIECTSGGDPSKQECAIYGTNAPELLDLLTDFAEEAGVTTYVADPS